MHFDWQTIATAIGGAVLGIGAVSTFLHTWIPKTRKYISLAAKSIGFLDSLAQSLEDDNLSAAEWDSMKTQAVALSAAWKEVKGL